MSTILHEAVLTPCTQLTHVAWNNYGERRGTLAAAFRNDTPATIDNTTAVFHKPAPTMTYAQFRGGNNWKPMVVGTQLSVENRSQNAQYRKQNVELRIVNHPYNLSCMG